MIDVNQIIETAPRLSTEDRARVLRSLGWLSMRELCQLTGYSPRSIYTFIQAGMPCYRGHGRQTACRFDQSAIDWLRDNGRKNA